MASRSTEQEPLVPLSLEESFPVGFFKRLAVNMTSCYNVEDNKDEVEEKQGKPPKYDDKTNYFRDFTEMGGLEANLQFTSRDTSL